MLDQFSGSGGSALSSGTVGTRNPYNSLFWPPS